MASARVKAVVNRLPMAAGSILLLLGTAVLLGWHSQQVVLVQILPQFVPMQYNTALGFVLSGLALIFINLNKARAAELFSAAMVFVGALTGFQYLTSVDIGIDQFFMEHYITTETSHPGRMAPNTALSFVLAGAGLFAAAAVKEAYRRRWVAGVVGSIVLGLGLVAVAGYAAGLSPAYGWGLLTRMAVHTAAGFSLLGLGLLSIAWQDTSADQSPEEKQAAWWPVSVTVFVVSFAVLLANALASYERTLVSHAGEPIRTFAPSVVLIFGVIMGILLGATLWVNRRSRLRAIAAKNLTRRLTAEEEALRQSEARYRHLIDSAEVSIWDEDLTAVFEALERLRDQGVEDLARHLDKNPRLVSELAALVGINGVNNATLRLFGAASEKEFISSIDKVFANNSHRVFADELCAIWDHEDNFRAEASHLTLAGKKIDVVISMPVPKTHSQAGSVPVSIFDITERKRAEEQVRKLSLTVEQSPASVVITDIEGVIEYVNSAFTLLTGYEAEEAIGKKPGLLVKSGETPPEVYEELWQTITSGRVWSGILRNKRKNGELYWSDQTISPIQDDEGTVTNFVGIGQDITERREIEQQLIQAKKMETVGQLTGGIAHDFNNILGIVMGNLELLQRQAADDPEMSDRVQKAIRGTRRGASLTKKLLGFSRQGAPAVKLTNVNAFIDSLHELIARSLTPSITVEQHLAADLWPVEIDPGDFEDAVLNLSLNARDAMPDGGTLVIETANKFLGEAYVRRNPTARAGEFVVISLSDTGHGMAPEIQERIFEPFFTTKEQGKGTGLGLSMVYGFVKRSGGHVKIYSEAGEGTTIHLYLPRAQGKTARDCTPGDIRGRVPRGSERILVVDDEADLVDVAVALLEGLGYRTLSANDGEQALKLFEEHQDIDLMFSDVVMPGRLDGYKLALAARKIRPALKVLLTSGFTRRREEFANGGNAATAALASKMLSKPYNRTELARAVRRTLDEPDSG